MATTSPRMQLRRDTLLSAESYRAPASIEEVLVARIWAEALSLDRVGLDDDFFDLGGDSLAAMSILTGLRREFALDVPTRVLINAPTVARLLPDVRDRIKNNSVGAVQADAMVFPLRSEGAGPPIILVPPRDDSAMRFHAMTALLRTDSPVYAVVHRSAADFATMVANQLNDISCVVAPGPLHLVGVCWGCLVALEMANQSAERGVPPASTILLDPPPQLTALDRTTSRLRKRAFPWLTLAARRLETYQGQFAGLSTNRKLSLVVDKFRAARRRMGPHADNSDLFRELGGMPHEQALADMALVHPLRRPPVDVHLILTRDRPDGVARRARNRWTSFLGAGTSVHWVPGTATGDVLLNHLPEFASTVELIVERSSPA